MNVRQTATEISAVIARPGPNARKKSSRPATSEAVPAATITPAVSTTRDVPAVAARIAANREPSSRPQASRKRGEEEDGVVGDQAEDEHDQHRLDLARHHHAGLLARPAEDVQRDPVGDRRPRRA